MNNFIGLYLGIDFVDLVILTDVKGNLQIVKSVRTFLFDGTSIPEQKDKALALPAGIKKAFESAKFNMGPITFGLPQDEVMVRHFKMPYLPEAERSNAVKFEAQKYLPFKVDETVSDFYITQESRETKNMEALFVAVNKQTMEKYVTLFRNLGTRVSVVDVTPIALLRVLSKYKKLTEEGMLKKISMALKAFATFYNQLT